MVAGCHTHARDPLANACNTSVSLYFVVGVHALGFLPWSCCMLYGDFIHGLGVNGATNDNDAPKYVVGPSYTRHASKACIQ